MKRKRLKENAELLALSVDLYIEDERDIFTNKINYDIIKMKDK